MRCKLFVLDNNIERFYDKDIENLDFVFLIYKGEISLTEELENPVVAKELCKLSKQKSFVLFLHFIAVIEDKKYLSVMVIDNGRIIGVSDSVTTKDYCASQRQRIYITGSAWAGIVVDEDIFHADSVSNLCQNKANLVVFMTFKDLDENYYRAFISHKFLNDIPIVATFNNKLCFFHKNTFIAECEKKYNFEISSVPELTQQHKKLKKPTFEY